MNEKTVRSIDVIVVYLEKLIADGTELLKKSFPVQLNSFESRDYLPVDDFHRWLGNCRVLKKKLGKFAEPWEVFLTENVANGTIEAETLLGSIRSIKDAVEGGHLVSYADLVVSEAFADLLEQARYLLDKDYWLAAGVLCRAVLEEELRELAQIAKCLPEKERPTLNDLNSSLYKNQTYDKLEFKLIDSLAAIGNECAHNTSGASRDRVQYLLDQLWALLPRLRG